MSDRFNSTSWEEWYRLARHALACRHEEAVEYANLRFVEEQNRASLRAGRGSGHRDERPRRWHEPPPPG